MAVTNIQGRQLDVVDVATVLVGDASALAVLVGDLATFAQGALADSAVQPGDNVSDLVNDSNFQGQVVPGTVGDFAALDASGNIIDGGSQASDFATAAQGALADSSLQNVTDTFTGVLTLTGTLDVSGGVDKLQSATTAIDVAAATAPTIGQILTAVSGTVANWQDAPTPVDAYTKLESDAAPGLAGAKINKVSGSSVGNVATLLADGQIQQGTPDAATPDDVTLLGGSATAGVAVGAAINLTAGDGFATGLGGAVNIAAGIGGLTNTKGGAIVLTSGGGGGAEGDSGDINITGGNPGADANGGTINITGSPEGANGYTAAGGVNVAGGDGFYAGDVTVKGGDSALIGDGGVVNIVGGISGAGVTGDGGPVNITSGAAVSTDGNGGDIVLTPGVGNGTGSAGATNITQTTAPTVTTNKLYNVGGELTWNGNILLDAADTSSFATAAQGALADSALQANVPTPTATTAQLIAIADAINTSLLKVAGYMVFNITTAAPVWAVGSADGDVWNDATGTLVHTPV